MDDPRRHHWEQATEWPLTAVALAFLAAYAWPILDPDLPADWVVACQVVGFSAWVLFALDYLARLWLSQERLRFVRQHLLDLAVVVLPILRPLRLLRLVTLLTVLNRHAGDSLRGRVAVYVVGATGLVLFIASLAVLDAEQDAPEAGITSFGDALWWALTTMTTVGYGDLYPTTAAGRFVAAGLMVAGVALLGVVTASLASWLIERVADVEEDANTATRRDVAALSAQVAELSAQLEARDT